MEKNAIRIGDFVKKQTSMALRIKPIVERQLCDNARNKQPKRV